MNKPNTDSKSKTVGWDSINWQKVERYVFKLQKRIYAASRRGEKKIVRKLQKTLMNSWSCKVLAVRRVTQENRGKRTAGVDGIKSLSPEARMKLVGQLKITGKSKPTRRVWIPKPGKEEKRPLGIPTMYDRALQGVVKAALEPEWEAKFEASSFGFRPGRACQDAIRTIKNAIQSKAKYVLDADIAKCYDGNLIYWSTRMGRHPEMPTSKAIRLKKQKGKCNWCGLHFREGDVLEEDHIIPTALGGKNIYDNFQLLHGHCHDEKTAIDLVEIRKKESLKFYEELSHEWSKVQFTWIDDIPVVNDC
ncbi:MAG: reverse transcriptase N-terminal domain-containing protein [Xenococcaceae cyanobacterium MO_188.B32]|nr:reverse transcriptase N-terminal domain-containing protein [Xenococcaceae cyanobacterium MO_188.B32]